jgi:hypothetical protein
MEVEAAAIGAGDAGAFLAPVLEGKEAKKGKPSYILAWGIDPEDATGFV